MSACFCASVIAIETVASAAIWRSGVAAIVCVSIVVPTMNARLSLVPFAREMLSLNRAAWSRAAYRYGMNALFRVERMMVNKRETGCG